MADLPAYRTGVVLAAGFGSRLAGTCRQTDLKPLTPVAGVPLILRTLGSLAVAGCERVVIVLGHEPADVRSALETHYRGPLDVAYVLNGDFERQNGLSVLAARPFVDGPFLLTMADHVMGDELMEAARRHTPPADGATLLVDYKLDAIFDMDDATKVLEREGRVEAISKTLETFNCVDTGVFVCTQSLMDALETVVCRRGDAALSDGVRLLAAQGRMRVLDIGEGFWQDVDTPEMLAHAEAALKEGSHVG